MTLSRQLVLLIVGLLLLVLIGTFFISVHNARGYLEEQLQSHAQDAATSLGASISSNTVDGDMVMAEMYADAMFRGGAYEQVVIQPVEGGEPLVKLDASVSEKGIEGIPSWFVSYLPLNPPRGEADVMSGFRQAARVYVTSHPGFAYEQLWENVTQTFWWFLACAVIGGIIGVFALRAVLKPLKDVEWQADSICDREFPILDRLPMTRELRRVVEAMNRLSRKVRNMLSESEQLANKFRAEANQDPVTKLSNKRYFEVLLEDRIESSEQFAQGALCLIQLSGFNAFNNAQGYAAGDELLREAAQQFEEVVADIPNHLLARLSGADFALLAEDISEEQARTLGDRLSNALSGLHDEGLVEREDVGHIGIAMFRGDQSLSELLSEADMALRSAQSGGANASHVYVPQESDRRDVRSAREWREVLDRALSDKRFVLYFQPVVACPDRAPIHHEVLVRLPDPEDPARLLSAGVFLPVAERLGLAGAIDRQVIGAVLHRIATDAEARSYAVNLSPHSVEAPGFIDWLEAELNAMPNAAPRIVLELPEYGAVSRLEVVRALSQRVNPLGARVSLDRFGRGFSSFAYLQSLKLSYLKIDGSFQRGLAEHKDNQFFVQTLSDICHGLDMTVVAEGIEDQATWDLLTGLHVDGAQGYFIGAPGALG